MINDASKHQVKSTIVVGSWIPDVKALAEQINDLDAVEAGCPPDHRDVRPTSDFSVLCTSCRPLRWKPKTNVIAPQSPGSRCRCGGEPLFGPGLFRPRLAASGSKRR